MGDLELGWAGVDQAGVGLFALTDIDDDLDLNCASQSAGARSTRDQSIGLRDHTGHKSYG